MKLLLLGGRKFLGRAVVRATRDRGHELTLFTRGETNPDLFPDVEHLRGDRDGDLAALEGRTWDAAVDTSGYVPRVVRASAELLAGSVAHLTFVSSVSVYADLGRRADEGSPLATLEDETCEDVERHYGALKALSEQAVVQVFPGRSLIVRPGLIVGPHDPTGRFTYWPVRIARGGDVLAPGAPERLLQLVDARDLAEWTIRMVERRTSGTFNVAGPVPRPTMGELLETCRSVSESDARFVWIDDAFLRAHEVGEWMELPLWVSDPQYRGLLDVDVERAVAAGLSFRPLADTVRDTLAWAREGGDVGPAGLAPEREIELIAAWRRHAA